MIAAERLSRLQSAPESTEELNEEQRQKIAERFRALAISLNYTPPPKEVAPEPPQHAHDPYRIDRVLHETGFGRRQLDAQDALEGLIVARPDLHARRHARDDI